MQLVDGSSLRLPPHKCVVTGRIDGEVIDFNVTPACTEAPNIAIRRDVIEEAARDHCGMATADQVAELRADAEKAQEELKELREFLDTAAEFEELGTRLQNALPKELLHA